MPILFLLHIRHRDHHRPSPASLQPAAGALARHDDRTGCRCERLSVRRAFDLEVLLARGRNAGRRWWQHPMLGFDGTRRRLGSWFPFFPEAIFSLIGGRQG
jgi:hypothetical protein